MNKNVMRKLFFFLVLTFSFCTTEKNKEKALNKILIKYIGSENFINEDRGSEDCIHLNRFDIIFRLYNLTNDSITLQMTNQWNYCQKNPSSPKIKLYCPKKKNKYICGVDHLNKGFSELRIMNGLGEVTINPLDSFDLSITQERTFSVPEWPRWKEMFYEIKKNIVNSGALITIDSLIQEHPNLSFEMKLDSGYVNEQFPEN